VLFYAVLGNSNIFCHSVHPSIFCHAVHPSIFFRSAVLVNQQLGKVGIMLVKVGVVIGLTRAGPKVKHHREALSEKCTTVATGRGQIT
jgi:hypothetical protein